MTKKNTNKRNDNKLGTTKRMKIKYAVSVLNENTLEEIYRVRLSGYNFFVLLMLFFIVLFILYSCLIIFTPLRNLLPENTDYALRKEVVSHAIAIDSLQRIVDLNQRYLDNVNGIFSGEVVMDEDDTRDSVFIKASNLRLMEKSEQEKSFCKEFESDEMYNFSNALPQTASITFFTPVQGLLAKEFNAGNGHLGIDISADDGAAISATADGVVLSSGYDHRDGYYIEILHDENYVSVYRGASEAFKTSGDVVKAGEVIGLVGKHDLRETPSLHFEIWSAMQPQNPLNYIVLE